MSSTNRRNNPLIYYGDSSEDYEDYGTDSDSEPENKTETETGTELGLSLDKLSLGPKKKLLILCLGGLLVHRVHLRDKSTVRGLRPDVVYGKFLGNSFIYLFIYLKFFVFN